MIETMDEFFVSPAADDPWGAWSSLPPLRVAAKTDVSCSGCIAAGGEALQSES